MQTWILLATVASALAADAINNRPIVGILTQPLNTEIGNSSKTNITYIAASYVKFVESAGARVVPIHFDASESEIKTLLKSINGVLLPGGGADIGNMTAFGKATKLVYDSVLEMNTAGDVFPLYGTCMGFQQLVLLTAETDSVICEKCYDSEGTPLPLDFTPAARSSKFFKDMAPDLYDALGKENITENSHHDGINPEVFKTNPHLKVRVGSKCNNWATHF
jgi:gamma-glutamyl hydrolase